MTRGTLFPRRFPAVQRLDEYTGVHFIHLLSEYRPSTSRRNGSGGAQNHFLAQ